MDKLWEYFLKTHPQDYYWWAWGKKKPFCYLYWLRGRVLYFFFGRTEAYYTALKRADNKVGKLQRELDLLKKIIRMKGADSIEFAEYISAYVGQPSEMVADVFVESKFFEMSDEEFMGLKDNG